MTISSPLWPCLKAALKLFGWIFGIMTVIGISARWLGNKPPLGLQHHVETVLVLVVITLALGLAFHALIWAWRWRIDDMGVSGRSFWGRKVQIRWEDVKRVSVVHIESVPALLISSEDRTKEVLAYVLGFDTEKIHEALRQRAGPAHALTRVFSQKAS